MNLTLLFRKSFILVFLLALSGSLLNAQARYKHIPRVKIKKTAVESVSNPTVESTIPVSTQLNTETSLGEDKLVTPVASNAGSETPITFAEKTIASTPAKKQSVQTKVKEEVHLTFNFTPMSHKKLFKPETTNKTNVGIALILLIVFYILAAIFTVLCVLAIYLWANFPMFIVFLILAIVFGLAGSVLSLLLKFGVVN